jgi:hypothetical protein
MVPFNTVAPASPYLLAAKTIPWFEKLRYGCMITVEKVNIVYYKNAERRGYFDN